MPTETDALPAVGCTALLERLKKRFDEEADAAYAIYDRMPPGWEREKMLGIVRGYEAAELIVIGEIESLSNVLLSVFNSNAPHHPKNHEPI